MLDWRKDGFKEKIKAYIFALIFQFWCKTFQDESRKSMSYGHHQKM